MDINKLLIKLASRKFILSLVSVSMTGVLTYLNVLDQTGYSSVVITITGAYLASNVYQDSQYAKSNTEN